MRRYYYVYYPRRCATEYIVYAASTPGGIRLAAQMRTRVTCSWNFYWRRFERITRQEAERLCGRGPLSRGVVDLDLMAKDPRAIDHIFNPFD